MNEHTVSPRAAVRDQTRHGEETRRTAAARSEPDKARDEAEEASALARHKDPSLTGKDAKNGAKAKRRPGVEWVRPTDLLASRSGRVAGRGIDFQAELARRTRRLPGQTVRATHRTVRSTAAKGSERARRLPPVSAFGRGSGQRFSWVSRSGIGLG